ncbi:hypothetical protein R6Q59_006054 [Mikania micrantha]
MNVSCRTIYIDIIYSGCDAQKLIKTPAEYCKDESDAGLPNSVSENVIRKSEHEMAPSTEGNKHKITEKSTKQGVETLAAHVKRTLILEGSETTRKVFSNSFVLLIIKTVFLLN